MHISVHSASVVFLPSCSPAWCLSLQLLSLILPVQVWSAAFGAAAATDARNPSAAITPISFLIISSTIRRETRPQYMPDFQPSQSGLTMLGRSEVNDDVGIRTAAGPQRKRFQIA